MDIRALMETRRTVHSFTTERVEDHLVEEALRLSLWAPNHKMSLPWVYTWLGPESRARLGQLNVDLKTGDGPPLTEAKAAAARDNVTTPSHLISLGMKRSPDPLRQHEDYAALAAGLQNAALFLWSHGIASKWSTGEWTKHPRSYEIVGVDPAQVVLEGCLMVGKPRMQPLAPVRPPLLNHLRRVP